MKRIYLIILPLSLLLTGCADMLTRLAGRVDPISYTVEAPKFEIHSPTNYFAPIFSTDLHKSQFETQVDYDARLRASQPRGRRAYLQVDPDLIHYVYDAEKQVLTVVLPPELSTGDDVSAPWARQPDSRTRFTIGRTDHSQFLGPVQDEFGVTTDAGYTKSETYQLSVLNFRDLALNTRWKVGDRSYSPVGLGLPVPVPAAEAEGLVKSKSVTLIFGLTVGDLHAAGHYDRTTAAMAAVYVNNIYELPVWITDIKVYHTQTGNILASWTSPLD